VRWNRTVRLWHIERKGKEQKKQEMRSVARSLTVLPPMSPPSVIRPHAILKATVEEEAKEGQQQEEYDDGAADNGELDGEAEMLDMSASSLISGSDVNLAEGRDRAVGDEWSALAVQPLIIAASLCLLWHYAL
jgi:hypothetical protein